MAVKNDRPDDLQIVDASRHIDKGTSAVREIFIEFSKGINKRDPYSLFILFLVAIVCILTILLLFTIVVGLVQAQTDVVQKALDTMLAIFILVIVIACFVTLFLSKLKHEYELKIAVINVKRRK